MFERMRQIDRKITQAISRPLVEMGSALLQVPIGVVARIPSGIRREWINWIALGALGNGKVTNWERRTVNLLPEPDKVIAEQSISSALREFKWRREASII